MKRTLKTSTALSGVYEKNRHSESPKKGRCNNKSKLALASVGAKSMRKFLLCFLLAIPCFAFAQTAERIERLLEQNRVSYRDAALLVLEASGHLDSEKQTSTDDAFSFAKERGWLPKNAQADSAARLNGLSLLVVRAFGIKGGAFFSLFKNPHYAYRAMVYRGIIQGRADPQMFVSGDLLLYTVNKVLETGSED
jgi:hypothetical protein